MSTIAATAVVDKSVEVGEEVVIGPGCVVEPGVVIGDGCVLKANVMVCRGVILGRNNRIFANCVLGDEPQSLGCVDPDTELIIGDNNVFRENVTIHRGSPEGGGRTVVGSDNYMMMGSHVGHDCEVEDHVVMVNSSHLGGHCKVEHHAWLSGNTMAHQFVTIGCYAYAAGMSAMSHDVPPFMRVSGGYPCEVRGVNVIGLRRNGFAESSIRAIDRCYRRLYRHRGAEPLAKVAAELSAGSELDGQVRYLLEFIQRSHEHRMNRYRELSRH